MNIWQYQDRVISRSLLKWAGFSIIAGVLMQFKNSKFWKNLGWQFTSWGLINAGIVVIGQVMAQERVASYENPGSPEILEKETDNLKRILLFNAVLDILYMLGGKSLADKDEGEGGRKGTGWGIILQGGFLFLFDLINAFRLPDPKK